MTAPVAQADAPRPDPSLPRPVNVRPDPESADRFRDALSRKGGKAEGKPARLAVTKKDVDEAAAAPAGTLGPAPLPVPIRPQKDQEQPGASTSGQRDIGAPLGHADAPAALPAASSTSAADAAAFAGLVARFDAGTTPSVSTHLALPGDQWRAEQVVIDQQGGGVSVSIDLGDDRGEPNEALKELEARLRARGLDARVIGASRIGEANNRIA